jgi:hypothetical protein
MPPIPHELAPVEQVLAAVPVEPVQLVDDVEQNDASSQPAHEQLGAQPQKTLHVAAVPPHVASWPPPPSVPLVQLFVATALAQSAVRITANFFSMRAF